GRGAVVRGVAKYRLGGRGLYQLAHGRAPAFEHARQLRAVFGGRLRHGQRLVGGRPPARAVEPDGADAEASPLAVDLRRGVRLKRRVFEPRDAAPDVVASIDRLAFAQHLRAHARVQTVRADKNVAGDLRPVVEARVDLFAVRVEPREGLAQLNRLRR